MIKSLSDVFNHPDAIINDPNEVIHTHCININYQPDLQEYQNMLDNLNTKDYPRQIDSIMNHLVNPLHGKLKSIY